MEGAVIEWFFEPGAEGVWCVVDGGDAFTEADGYIKCDNYDDAVKMRDTRKRVRLLGPLAYLDYAG